jgi:hypothetical protein
MVQADLASATPRSVMIINRNVALSRAACAKRALITAYAVGSSLSDAVKGSGTFQSSEGLDSGPLLHELVLETALGNGSTDTAALGTATISAISIHATTPTVTTTAPHGFRVGDVVTISGSNSTPTLNLSSFTILTVPTDTTFTISATTTGAGSAGTLDRITNTGGKFFLQATSVQGTTPSVPVVLKDSADGVTFATLATLTITAAGAQEVDISGNIRKYTRVEWTVTGTSTPGATFAAVLTRNNLN